MPGPNDCCYCGLPVIGDHRRKVRTGGPIIHDRCLPNAVEFFGRAPAVEHESAPMTREAWAKLNAVIRAEVRKA